MSISLEKKAEKVGILLEKKGINVAPTLRVGIAIDISGSMDMRPHLIYSSGKLQAAFDQIMGVAVKFDDNGELDVFQFNTDCEYVGTSTPENHANYIKENIRISGGTNYSPIVEEALDFFFSPKQTKTSGGFLGFGKKTVVEPADETPVLMIVLTDGEPNDRSTTMTVLKQSQSRPIYWHFVGIGGTKDDFTAIAHLADALPNVGEVYLPRIDMTDDEIYEQVICDELVEWVGKWVAPKSTTA